MSLAPLPALVVGAVVMRSNGVSSAIWTQQLAAGFILAIGCIAMSFGRRTIFAHKRRRWTITVGCGALLLLAATLLHSGIDGVRRWVPLGPLHLHSAFVALPVLIILASQNPKPANSFATSLIAAAAVIIAAIVLMLQPDASQAVAFAIAMAVVLLQRRPLSRIDWITTAVCVGAALFALSRPDPLEAVPHVEGIVGLAARGGVASLAVAILTLVLLPLPFVADTILRARCESSGLAAYFIIVCVAPFLAPYPVPLLGYGLSPVFGYFLALGWIVRSDPSQMRDTALEFARRGCARSISMRRSLMVCVVLVSACTPDGRTGEKATSADAPKAIECVRAESLAAGGLWYSNAEYSHRGWTDGGWRMTLAPAHDSTKLEVFGEAELTPARVAGEWWAVLDTIAGDPGLARADEQQGEKVEPAGAAAVAGTYLASPSPPETRITLRPTDERDTNPLPSGLPTLEVRLDCRTAVLRFGSDSLILTRRAGPNS